MHHWGKLSYFSLLFFGTLHSDAFILPFLLCFLLLFFSQLFVRPPFCEDLQDLLELTPQKDILFIIGDWNAKVGSQETPGITGKFGFGVQNEAGQRLTEFLPREHTGHCKHSFPTTQEKTLHMDITRWSTPKSDWLYSLQPKEKLYTVSKNKIQNRLWLRSWTPYCQIQT